jgi:cholesterol transport system auxiliary component
MTMSTVRVALLGWASSLLLVAGCAGNLLKSDVPAPETFRLATAVPQAAVVATPVPFAIAVARPRAAAAIDTDRIAIAAAGNRFDYYAAARWAEPAPLMLQASVVAALAASGQFSGGVVAAPSRVPAELLLEIELRRFEAVSGSADPATGAPPVVHVQAQASLVDTRRSARVASFTSAAQVQAEANRLGSVVAAFDLAQAQVVAGISAQVTAAAAALPAQ